jgi:AAA domain
MSEFPNVFDLTGGVISYPKHETKPRFWWAWEAEVAETEWLIDKWLPAKSCVWLYGKHGAGKSFATLHMGMSLGTGQDWHGNRTFERTGVVYWNGEKKARFGKRVKSWMMAHRPDQTPAVAFQDHALNLLDEGQLSAFIDGLQGMKDEFDRIGAPLGCVILDTLARCVGGANISENAVGNAVNAALQRVIDEVGVTVLCVAHVAKTEGADSIKGAGEFGDGADAYIRVEREKGSKLRTLHLGKQSDGEDGLQAAFEMDVIEVGEGRQGPIVSLAVREVDCEGLTLTSSSRSQGQKLTENDEKVLTAIRHFVDNDRTSAPPPYPGLPVGARLIRNDPLRDYAYDTGFSEKGVSDTTIRQRWRASKLKLEQAGYVRLIEGGDVIWLGARKA